MTSDYSKTDVKILCEYSELVDLKKLIPHPKNRNTHSSDQIDRLAKLIFHHGFRLPIIVSTLSGKIVAGHGRLLASKKLGMTTVPVDYQDFPDEEAEYAFLISDNAIADWAELDLGSINQDIIDLGPDFDLELLGLKDFSLDPLEKMEEGIKEKELDENIETVHECPSCGYKW